MTKLDQITLPYLILAEGAGDAAFFDHLIAARGIADEFHVTHPSRAPSVTGSGSTRFRQALDAFGIFPGFDTLRGIIIVTDCDDDETAAFTNVQDHIRHTAKRHPAPVRPLQKSSGSPPIVVMMIPWIGESGSLEALCVPAANRRFPWLRPALMHSKYAQESITGRILKDRRSSSGPSICGTQEKW